jgi:pimeloyl-ACP methyl ester carboxylesterase
MHLDRRLVRPGAVIAFADSGGDGRPLLLTHGAGMDHLMYEEQTAALLDAGHRVIVWDLRGHGESSLSGRPFSARDALDDMRAVVEEVGAKRPVLVGHSLGGNLSQALVRESPRIASGLIVIDASWNAGPLTALERRALRFAAPVLSAVPAAWLPGMMARASAASPDAIERTRQTFARMPKAVFLDVWRATVSLISPEPGYRTPIPLALIRGGADRTGNITTAMPGWADAEGIAEHVVPDAGHVVTWDAPAAVSAVLRQILQEPRFSTPSR